MAELNTVTRTKIAQVAGTKAAAGSFNGVRTLFIDTPAAWTAANGDTAGTGIVLPVGARLSCPVTVSNGTGAASSTLDVGLRNASTKVASSSTAIVAAVALTTAQTIQVNTGAKVTAGQYYVLTEESEVYLTFGGAAPTANQAIRIELSFVSP